jgi:STE24 endopeptidase
MRIAGWIRARLFLVLASAALGAACPARGAELSDRPTTVAKPSTDDEQTPVPVPVPSARALSFYRSGNWLWVFDELWDLAVLSLLLFTGLSARLRTLARAIASSLLPRRRAARNELSDEPMPQVGVAWFLTIAIYVVLFMFLTFLIDLPLHYYQGFVRLHAYGLSNQTFAKWFGDSMKRTAVSAFVGALVTWVPFLLILRSPRRWWLYTTLFTVPFLFAVMLLKPIWVDPLFNDFGPMKDKSLEKEILALGARAGVEGSRVYEVNKSVDTKAVNAYVTGILGTKRIVLWDTLLARLDDKEVVFVMGHEMGHYVLGHVPRTILLSTVITLASLFWVDQAGRRLMARFSARFGFDRLSDVAAVPLLLLLMQISSLVLGPVAYAYSRYQEHEADRFALELTRTNRSAALAFVKLQTENLSNPQPGLFYKIWRSTHPTGAERIEFANEYHPWRDGRPLRFGTLFRP